MAQHDYIIANQSGAAFRADLNNGLAAIVSQNSGAAQPSTTYAYQWWADTTTGLLKLRNAANNAWITIGTLADENLGLSQLANSAVQATTSGTAINFTGIPSWATRITVNFFQVSTSGTSPVQVQIGSGSYQTTGYLTVATALSGSTSNVGTYTTGFVIAGSTAPATRYGSLVFTNIEANGWVGSGISYESSTGTQSTTSGGIQLTSAISQLRLTTVNGTETFDGGVASITYEG